MIIICNKNQTGLRNLNQDKFKPQHIQLISNHLFAGLILVKNIFLMVIKNFVWPQPKMERFENGLAWLPSYHMCIAIY